MKRFGVLLASAAFGAALAASGPALAFGGHGGGGFGGRHMFAGRSMAMGGLGHGWHNGWGHGGWGHGWHNAWGHGWHNCWGRNCWGGNCGWGGRWPAFAGLDWGGGWGYPYQDNAYSGYSNPSSYYSYSTVYGAAPLANGGSVATGQPVDYCVISVKACQTHKPSFAGSDCSCKVPGGAASGVP